MGYEIKVIIGQYIPSKNEDLQWLNIIAEYDLCNVDLEDLQSCIKSKGAKFLSRADIIERKRIYFYEGDTKITEDKYGEELIAFDPNLLLEVLIEERKADGYRRYPPLIALLESMLKEFTDGFHVVLYGH